MKELKSLIERAILVAGSRDGDVDTEDGTFATVDVDELIRLEEAIEEFFGRDVSEVCALSDFSFDIVFKNKLDELGVK